MRIGIFGGSFDPPHIGHLLVAQDAREALALDRLIVIPAATQPLKQEGRTVAAHRLAMVERCFEDVRGIDVDPIEIERGGLSFMVDTVDALLRRWPSATLHLLVGEDVVRTLSLWREPARLLSMVQLVVLRRDLDEEGNPFLPSSDSGADTQVQGAIDGARRLETRRVDVSSTEIRARVRAGRSIRGFVPAAVESYIASAGLYVRVTTADDVPARA